jgi:hypothetical protein
MLLERLPEDHYDINNCNQMITLNGLVMLDMKDFCKKSPGIMTMDVYNMALVVKVEDKFSEMFGCKLEHQKQYWKNKEEVVAISEIRSESKCIQYYCHKSLKSGGFCF